LPVTVVALVTVKGEVGPETVFNLNLLPGRLLETGELKEYVTLEPESTHKAYGRSA
jgi:hypothetical protein